MAKKNERKPDTRTEAEKLKDKKAAFVRVVTPRIGKALKAIRVVGYCATGAYHYNTEQTTAIIKALTEAVQGVKDRYEGKVTDAEGFKLPN